MQLVALVAALLLLTAISVVAIVYVLRARVFVIPLELYLLFSQHTPAPRFTEPPPTQARLLNLYWRS